MGCRKVRSAGGDWSLRLRSDTPRSITDEVSIATQAFSHVVILPAWVDPTVMSVADLVSLSIFTGILMSRRNRLEIGGPHATAWAKTMSGVGAVRFWLTPSAPKTFRKWILASFAADPAPGIEFRVAPLAAGSIQDTFPATDFAWDPDPVTTFSFTTMWDSGLDDMCEWATDLAGGVVHEWRVNDDLTIDAGTLAYLWPGAATVLLTPELEGRDAGLVGMRAVLDVPEDVEDYADRVPILTSDGTSGSYAPSFSVVGSPYTDFHGEPTDRNAPAAPSTLMLAAAKAANALAQRDHSRRQITASTDQFAVMTDLSPGDPVFVFDPDNGVLDFANEIPYRGRLTWPAEERVVSIDMPFERGMGAVLIQGGTTVVDLTPWIVPEAPGARIDLGATDRNLT